jgi:DNA helicase IV
VATPDLTVRQAVVRTRQQLRVTGRRPESRIVARPLLIKGLEFDHAVVTDSWSYDAHELYVCLTRGSKSLAVVATSPAMGPGRPISCR